MKKLISREKGQGLVEYSLIIGFATIVVVASLILFSDEIVFMFNNIVCEFGGNPSDFTCPT